MDRLRGVCRHLCAGAVFHPLTNYYERLIAAFSQSHPCNQIIAYLREMYRKIGSQQAPCCFDRSLFVGCREGERYLICGFIHGYSTHSACHDSCTNSSKCFRQYRTGHRDTLWPVTIHI